MQISSTQLMQYVGRSPAAPEFDDWLGAHRIHDRPHVAQDDDEYDENPDQALRSARDSEIDEVERFSVALIYENAANYSRLFGPDSGQWPSDDGNFVLKQIAFYAPSVQGYRGFEGPLPFGLTFGSTEQENRRKLGHPWATRTVHELRCDMWLTQGWQVNASYLGDGGGLGILHVRRWHQFDRQALGLEAPRFDRGAVDVATLRMMLGHAGDDARLAAALEPLGWDASLVDLSSCDEVPDYIRRGGVTLYFDPIQPVRVKRGHASTASVSAFSGFRLNRTGDMNSQGFAGVLPFGIKFCDTPQQAVDRVGTQPDRQVSGHDVGAYIWNFSDYRLHVMFSLIDYQVYRISCFLPQR